MATYSGPLNVLQDGQGSVIPIRLFPSDIPPSGGLILDVSSLAPPNGQFGYIAGLTVDATATNVAAGIVSLSFDGGYNLVRNANGGNTQVYKVSGNCLRITIQNLAWTSGAINFILWNSQPANELQSPLTVVAQGSVSISGTPTVQFAPGQTVSIAAGTVNIGTVAGTVTIEPGAHNINDTFLNNTRIASGASGTILGAGNAGSIRIMHITGTNIINYGPPGLVEIAIMDITAAIFYWSGFINFDNTMQEFVNILFLSSLAIPFTNGLIAKTFPPTGMFVDSNAQIHALIGWN